MNKLIFKKNILVISGILSLLIAPILVFLNKFSRLNIAEYLYRVSHSSYPFAIFVLILGIYGLFGIIYGIVLAIKIDKTRKQGLLDEYLIPNIILKSKVKIIKRIFQIVFVILIILMFSGQLLLSQGIRLPSLGLPLLLSLLSLYLISMYSRKLEESSIINSIQDGELEVEKLDAKYATLKLGEINLEIFTAVFIIPGLILALALELLFTPNFIWAIRILLIIEIIIVIRVIKFYYKYTKAKLVLSQLKRNIPKDSRFTIKRVHIMLFLLLVIIFFVYGVPLIKRQIDKSQLSNFREEIKILLRDDRIIKIENNSNYGGVMVITDGTYPGANEYGYLYKYTRAADIDYRAIFEEELALCGSECESIEVDWNCDFFCTASSRPFNPQAGVEQLINQGADPAIEQELRFRFYFPTEEDAQKTHIEISNKYPRMNLPLIERFNSQAWLLKYEVNILLDSDLIKMSNYFIQLAKNNNGKLDSFQAEKINSTTISLLNKKISINNKHQTYSKDEVSLGSFEIDTANANFLTLRITSKYPEIQLPSTKYISEEKIILTYKSDKLLTSSKLEEIDNFLKELALEYNATYISSISDRS